MWTGPKSSIYSVDGVVYASLYTPKVSSSNVSRLCLVLNISILCIIGPPSPKVLTVILCLSKIKMANIVSRYHEFLIYTKFHENLLKTLREQTIWNLTLPRSAPPPNLVIISGFYVSVKSNWIHPPGNPRNNSFERANPGHPAVFLCYFLHVRGAKNHGLIPGGGAKFSQTRRNCSLSLQKILKIIKKTTGQYKSFIWRT